MNEPMLLQRGAFGMPKPQGWTIERLVSLLAGLVVITAQIAGGQGSPRLRFLTAWVGANLVLHAVVGWCPASVLLHRLGVPTAAERAAEQRHDRRKFSASAAHNR